MSETGRPRPPEANAFGVSAKAEVHEGMPEDNGSIALLPEFVDFAYRFEHIPPVTLANGDKYYGEINDPDIIPPIPDGEGCLIRNNKIQYFGWWKNGQYDGNRGFLLTKAGNIIESSFSDGLPNGIGRYHRPEEKVDYVYFDAKQPGKISRNRTVYVDLQLWEKEVVAGSDANTAERAAAKKQYDLDQWGKIAREVEDALQSEAAAADWYRYQLKKPATQRLWSILGIDRAVVERLADNSQPYRPPLEQIFRAVEARVQALGGSKPMAPALAPREREPVKEKKGKKEKGEKTRESVILSPEAVAKAQTETAAILAALEQPAGAAGGPPSPPPDSTPLSEVDGAMANEPAIEMTPAIEQVMSEMKKMMLDVRFSDLVSFFSITNQDHLAAFKLLREQPVAPGSEMAVGLAWIFADAGRIRKELKKLIQTKARDLVKEYGKFDAAPILRTLLRFDCADWLGEIKQELLPFHPELHPETSALHQQLLLFAPQNQKEVDVEILNKILNNERMGLETFFSIRDIQHLDAARKYRDKWERELTDLIPTAEHPLPPISGRINDHEYSSKSGEQNILEGRLMMLKRLIQTKAKDLVAKQNRVLAEPVLEQVGAFGFADWLDEIKTEIAPTDNGWRRFQEDVEDCVQWLSNKVADVGCVSIVLSSEIDGVAAKRLAYSGRRSIPDKTSFIAQFQKKLNAGLRKSIQEGVAREKLIQYQERAIEAGLLIDVKIPSEAEMKQNRSKLLEQDIKKKLADSMRLDISVDFSVDLDRPEDAKVIQRLYQICVQGMIRDKSRGYELFQKFIRGVLNTDERLTQETLPLHDPRIRELWRQSALDPIVQFYRDSAQLPSKVQRSQEFRRLAGYERDSSCTMFEPVVLGYNKQSKKEPGYVWRGFESLQDGAVGALAESAQYLHELEEQKARRLLEIAADIAHDLKREFKEAGSRQPLAGVEEMYNAVALQWLVQYDAQISGRPDIANQLPDLPVVTSAETLARMNFQAGIQNFKNGIRLRGGFLDDRAVPVATSIDDLPNKEELRGVQLPAAPQGIVRQWFHRMAETGFFGNARKRKIQETKTTAYAALSDENIEAIHAVAYIDTDGYDPATPETLLVKRFIKERTRQTLKEADENLAERLRLTA